MNDVDTALHEHARAERRMKHLRKLGIRPTLPKKIEAKINSKETSNALDNGHD